MGILSRAIYLITAVPMLLILPASFTHSTTIQSNAQIIAMGFFTLGLILNLLVNDRHVMIGTLIAGIVTSVFHVRFMTNLFVGEGSDPVAVILFSIHCFFIFASGLLLVNNYKNFQT